MKGREKRGLAQCKKKEKERKKARKKKAAIAENEPNWNISF